MPTSVLHVLGSGAAYSDGRRTTTMLALDGSEGIVLVDCGGDVVQRLLAQGMDPLRIRKLIVTHEHADHVGGLPLLMERLWMAGRRDPLPVYGIEPAIDQAQRLHDVFHTADWPDYPGIRTHLVAYEEDALVFDCVDWRITATPGIHSVPAVGLRVTCASGTVVAFSGDTAYTPAITRMAGGADLLLHEASGSSAMHASAEEAAKVASEAGVGRLVLVHLPPVFDECSQDLRAARKVFPELTVGADGDRFVL